MVNRMIKWVITMLLIAAVLSTSVMAADSGAGTMIHSDRTVIAPGFAYYTRTYLGEEARRQNGFSLELSANSEIYPIVMACDTIWGGMTMDDMVHYAEAMGYHVAAAVNTAFFNTPGVPIGIVVEDGILKSTADGLNAFAIMEDGTYYTAKRPQVRFQLNNAAWGQETCELKRLNKLFDEKDIQLYTSAYSTVSTRVEEDAWVVRMLINEGEMKLNGTVNLTVTEVLPETQAVPIGDEYMILTASTEGKYADFYKRFAVGDTITITTICADESLQKAKYVTGCGDILVENGKISNSDDWMHHIAGSNPRTMVGWRADGTLVMYVADGRDPGKSEGLTLRQAAEEMLRQGCVNAVNMDGGGSSIIGARIPGQTGVGTLNRPSDGGQRQCAAYLLLVTDHEPDGIARNWHLHQNNLTVLPGQHVYLTAYATDAALFPVQTIPETLFYSDAQRIFDDNLYIAPDKGGTHQISMWGGNAVGVGDIKVVANPDLLKITNRNGRVLDTVSLAKGEQLELEVVAIYNGKRIPADTTVVEYEMSVPMGTVDERGIFTAKALPGTKGVLTLRVGSYTQQVQITVTRSATDISQNRIKTALDRYNTAA